MKALTTRQQEGLRSDSRSYFANGHATNACRDRDASGVPFAYNAAEEHLKALARKGVIEIVSVPRAVSAC